MAMTSSTTMAPNRTNHNVALPVRRVGSLTLGVCLIAAGIFFFAYSFVPQFDGELALRASPAAALCLLGAEVLYFAARPGKMKCDFLSVLICLLLLGVCGCLALVPQLWDEVSPHKLKIENKLAAEYVSAVYTSFETDAPDIALRDMSADLELYTAGKDLALDSLPDNYDHLNLYVELYGPYEGSADFVEDCFALLKIIKQQATVPTRVVFSGEGNTQAFSLDMRGEVQQGWSPAEMARETQVHTIAAEDNADRTADAASQDAMPQTDKAMQDD